MISLKDFKENITQMVKPNRFLVEIYPPSSYVQEYSIDILRYLTQGAKIPDRTCGEIEMKYHGMTLKLPGDYTHDDLSLTFFNYYDWTPRNFFEDWMNLIQNVGDVNQRSDASSLFDAGITVKQIGLREDEVLASYVFYDVFPKNLAAIELGMDNTDQVETFTVDFAYSHWWQDWEAVTANTGPSSQRSNRSMTPKESRMPGPGRTGAYPSGSYGGDSGFGLFGGGISIDLGARFKTGNASIDIGAGITL